MRIARCQEQPVCYVKCVVCGRDKRIGECYADLDGEAFVDYYCEACVPMEVLR